MLPKVTPTVPKEGRVFACVEYNATEFVCLVATFGYILGPFRSVIFLFRDAL